MHSHRVAGKCQVEKTCINLRQKGKVPTRPAGCAVLCCAHRGWCPACRPNPHLPFCNSNPHSTCPAWAQLVCHCSSSSHWVGGYISASASALALSLCCFVALSHAAMHFAIVAIGEKFKQTPRRFDSPTKDLCGQRN